MPKWIKSIYILVAGRKISPKEIRVYDNYSSGKRKIDIIPTKEGYTSRLYRGNLKQFIKSKEAFKNRSMDE